MCSGLCDSCGCNGADCDNERGTAGGDGEVGGSGTRPQNPNQPNPVQQPDRDRDELSDEGAGNVFPGRRRRIRRLWCQTGFDLAVYPNGTVRGTVSPKNKYALLEFEPVGMDGHIRIKGISTDFYVTMNQTGKIYAQPLSTNRGTIWIETGLGSGATYHSLLSLDYAHKGYYLGLKKNGKPKEGPKTAHPYPQKATSFISRIVAEE